MEGAEKAGVVEVVVAGIIASLAEEVPAAEVDVVVLIRMPQRSYQVSILPTATTYLIFMPIICLAQAT